MESRKEPPTTATSRQCVIIPSSASMSSGTVRGQLLRPGNVHSAERWREVLEPIAERYQKKGVRLLFRGDAALPGRRYMDTWRHRASAMPGSGLKVNNASRRRGIRGIVLSLTRVEGLGQGSKKTRVLDISVEGRMPQRFTGGLNRLDSHDAWYYHRLRQSEGLVTSLSGVDMGNPPVNVIDAEPLHWYSVNRLYWQ